jgi:hypothetical protein
LSACLLEPSFGLITSNNKNPLFFVAMNEPWSKRHKHDFKGCQYSLSNSFAEPLSHAKLIKYTKDEELLRLYNEHDLQYIPNGGSMDLREDIARVVYDSKLSAENILVFPGGKNLAGHKVAV